MTYLPWRIGTTGPSPLPCSCYRASDVDVLWTELLLEAVADNLKRVDLVADEPVVVGVCRVVIQKVLASWALEFVNWTVIKALSFKSNENLAFSRVDHLLVITSLAVKTRRNN